MLCKTNKEEDAWQPGSYYSSQRSQITREAPAESSSYTGWEASCAYEAEGEVKLSA